MTDAELKKIAGKIAACLALAQSNNPTEAETAKRQAAALMAKYNLTSGDVAAASVHEKSIPTGVKHKTPLYLCKLGGIIAAAFGCEVVNSHGGGYHPSALLFLGMGIKPELAAYTFDVLRRQISKDRTAYYATLHRYKRVNKIHKAEVFCTAWLARVSQQVTAFAGTETEQAAITAYKSQRWGGGLKTDSRAHPEAGKKDFDAIMAGARAADNVQLHQPVTARRSARIGQQ